MDPKSLPRKSPEGSPHPDDVVPEAWELQASERAATEAEIASAAAVLQNLVKAVRGFSLYLPNNPLHEKFFEDFHRRLGEHLEEFGDLRLDFAHDDIRCRGVVVHTHEDRRENLGFRMHADGLRTLVLKGGIEVRETRTLVELIKQSVAEGDEDDIVTGLWSGDLPHVTYVLAEAPPAPAVALLPGAGYKEVQDGAIRRCAAALAAVEPPAAPPSPPKNVFTIDEAELAALEALLETERRRTPIMDVTGILEAVIGAETEPRVLEEFLEIVVRLCGELVIAGRFDHAVGLIGIFVRGEARPGVPPQLAERIAGARARVITPEVFAGLGRLLGDAAAVPREDLRDLVTALGIAAIEPFCRLLGEVTVKETRKVLIEALAETGRHSTDLFLPYLADPRWFLVRNTIYILRRIPSPAAGRAVRGCAGHRDARVRKEVVLYLDETGDPEAEPTLLALLSDPVPSLRIAAARSLARRGSRAAAEQLFTLAASSAFEQRESLERETVWEALGDLAPARALAILKPLLLKRYWLGSGRELQETACAVAGLRRIGTPEAVELLQRAAAAKRGAARELVEKALRALALAPRGPGPQHPDEEARRRG